MTTEKIVRIIIKNVEFDTDGDGELAEKLKKEWKGKEIKADILDILYGIAEDTVAEESGWLVESLDIELPDC